ncbi:hypothetical protein FRB90_005421 [Tulasnella sp. 427]|nr:hypothetical protein FRB90_005421 [Tulasnella sp. 427]
MLPTRSFSVLSVNAVKWTSLSELANISVEPFTFDFMRLPSFNTDLRLWQSTTRERLKSSHPNTRNDDRWRIFSDIMKLIPDAKRRLQSEKGEDYLTRLASALDDGISSARSDDTNGMKKAIADWVSTPSEGRVSRTSKENRGFHNPITARLLAPPRYNIDDATTLRNLCNEVIRPRPNEYAPFMYKDYSINSENIIEGLFESELLLRAAKHILIGPSAAESLEPVNNRSTRLGNAALNNMTEVTFPFIAYVCTQVRFALSSEETFGQRRGSFDIYGFYRDVLRTLWEPELADDFEVIRDHWNEVIFGGGSDEDDDDTGTLSQILAQRAA